MSDDGPGTYPHLLPTSQHPAIFSASARLYHAKVAGSVGGNPSSHAISCSDYHHCDHKTSPTSPSDQGVMVSIDCGPGNVFPPQHQPTGFVMVSALPSRPVSSLGFLSGTTGRPDMDAQGTQIDGIDDHCENSTPASIIYKEPTTSESRLTSQGRGEALKTLDRQEGGQDPAPPVWSELKTKAGKDRKRLPLACIACRRKKIRCSGEKPACKHCLRSRIPCVYKVTTRKAAPRTDYMAMLDKRLKRMEERIIKILPKSDQAAALAVPRAVVKPASRATGASAKSARKKRSAEEAFGPDLEAWPKALQPQLVDHESDLPDSRGAEESQLLREGVDFLPPKDIQEHLAEVFFDNVYGQAFHLLHKPSYMRKLRSEALPPVLILSVCAVAARFTSNPKLKSTSKQFMRGEVWASVARDICTKRYDLPNITILTCLLILGLHEFGTCHGGRAWALSGQAIRMAFALQLHKDLEYDAHARNTNTKLSFIDREIRRRTMWACFIMDRFNSSGTDRPIFIRDEAMEIPLPVAERYFQLDMPAHAEYLDGRVPKCELPAEAQLNGPRESMGVSAYTIRSIAIWGRVLAYINQGGKDADPHPMGSSKSILSKLVWETEELLRTLPKDVRYTRANLAIHRTEKTASQLIFLHMSIHQNLLFLHQAAATFSRDFWGKTAPKDFVLQSNAKTFLAANAISDLLRDAENAQCNIFTPFAGYCAFASAAIHIAGIFSGNSAIKTASEVNSAVNVKFLRKMMNHWGMFHWMVENIRTQYHDALDAARTGGLMHGSTASAPILQCSDWFTRYPHGVSDPDYMDPSIYQKKEKGEDGALGQKPELQAVGDVFTTTTTTAPTAGNGSRGPGQRRKATKRKTTHDEQAKKTILESSGPSVASSQAEAQQQQQSGPGTSSLTLGVVGVPQPQTMQSLQPMPVAQGFFTTDCLSMDLGRSADDLLQALDSDGLLMDSAMGGFGSWSDFAHGAQSDDTTPQSQYQYTGQEWFPSNQDVLVEAKMAPFGNLFGGLSGMEIQGDGR